MAKLKDPHSIHYAIDRMADDLGGGQEGRSVLANVAQVKVDVIYKWADPDDNWKPSLQQMAAMDAAYTVRTGKPGRIFAVHARLVETYETIESHADADPLMRFADTMAAAGKIATELHASMADGVITPAEALRCKQVIAATTEQLEKLGRDLDGRSLKTVGS